MESPCIRVCCLDDADICLGCGRSLEEIKNWSLSSESEQQQIASNAEQRRAQRADSLAGFNPYQIK